MKKKITLTESELKSLIENMTNEKKIEMPKKKKTITLSESELKTLIENVINKAEKELVNESKTLTGLKK